MRIIISWVLLAIAIPLWADSDGYYCSAADYLAYNTGITVQTDGHRLHVIRFGKDGISSPIIIPLPFFQVHGMRCEPDQIKLLGWDAIYTIRLAKEAPPAINEDKLPKPGMTVEGFEQDNLGQWARKDNIVLAGGTYNDQFALRITKVISDSKKAPMAHQKTELVQIDSSGKVLSQKTLIELDIPSESCGS